MEKAVIIYASTHHGSTKKLAEAIANQYDVHLIDAAKQHSADLSAYDLIGFASGIDFGKFYESVDQFLEKNLPENKRVFFLYTCAFADKIIAESRECDTWYEYFDAFAMLLNHPKSLVRNRAMHILAANAQWDEENRFDAILPEFLSHVTDEKPITARQCIQALAEVGLARPQYIPQILSCFHNADLSKYKDSMRPLIEKDMVETEKVLLSGER